MELIDQGGKRVRKACDRCHRVRAKVRGGLCEDCRAKNRELQESAKAFLEFARAFHKQISVA